MVLIFIDKSEGHIKKASLEAISYGAEVAKLTGMNAEGVVLGSVSEDLPSLGKYGVKKIHHVNNPAFDQFDAQSYTAALAELVKSTGAKVVIFSHNVDGKSVAPRLSARLKAGLVAGAIGLPETGNGFVVKKNVFSGKAFANVALNTDIKIISLNPNAFRVNEGEGSAEV